MKAKKTMTYFDYSCQHSHSVTHNFRLNYFLKTELTVLHFAKQFFQQHYLKKIETAQFHEVQLLHLEFTYFLSLKHLLFVLKDNFFFFFLLSFLPLNLAL